LVDNDKKKNTIFYGGESSSFQFSDRNFSLSVSILWAETNFNKNIYSMTGFVVSLY